MTGSGTLLDPYVIWDVNDLQNVSLDLTAHYELGQDIDALPTSGWNGGKGFEPLGGVSANPTEVFPSDHYKHFQITVYPAGPPTCYDKILTDDEDSSYVQTSSIMDGVGFTCHFDTGVFAAVPADAINIKIGVYMKARRVGGTGMSQVKGLMSNPNLWWTDEPPLSLSVDGQWYTATLNWTKNPVTGLAWTISDFANIHALGAIQLYGAIENAVSRFTKLSVVVTWTQRFTGSFDGKKYAISNLYINRPTTDYVGLFGYTDGAILQNTLLSNVDITGLDYVGALVGYAKNTKIDTSAVASGDVSGDDRVGGLVGYTNGDIDNCYSRNNISGDTYIGGLVGHNSGTIDNCYSTGVVTGTSRVGGLCGSNGGIITACFWDMETSGQIVSAGGIGKTTQEMNHCDIFIAAGWDFTTIWNISRVTTGLPTNITPGSAALNGLLDLTIINDAYPFLQWQTLVELPCDCGFEWGETEAFGHVTAIDSKNTGESFAKPIAGLEAQRTYYYRARASASPGPIHGGTKSFTTLHAIEVETLPATNITENSARIWGRVRKVPVTAMARFDWGGNIEYGAQTPWAQGLVSDDTFFYDLRNLAEGRAYHFRAMAMGSALVYGNDMTFTTRSPVGPVVLIQEELAHLMEVS